MYEIVVQGHSLTISPIPLLRNSQVGEADSSDLVKPNVVKLKSHFTLTIDEVQVDTTKQVPLLEKYDGMGDPYVHTQTYEHLMRYYGHSDAARCHLFVTTLKKEARQWMTYLPPNSVESW